MIKIKVMICGKENVEFAALINHVTIGKTNGANKTNYLSITFQDSSGTIDAKLWNASDEQIKSLVNGAVVRGKGDIIKYSDDRQMKIVSIDHISYEENDQIQFLAKAPVEANQMINEIMTYIMSISNMKIFVIINKLVRGVI